MVGVAFDWGHTGLEHVDARRRDMARRMTYVAGQKSGAHGLDNGGGRHSDSAGVVIYARFETQHLLPPGVSDFVLGQKSLLQILDEGRVGCEANAVIDVRAKHNETTRRSVDGGLIETCEEHILEVGTRRCQRPVVEDVDARVP